MSKAGFQPVLFGDFGKVAKDLFKKKFDFENQLVVLNTSASGEIAIETRLVSANEAPLRGVFKSALKVKDAGKLAGVFESEFHTVSDKESKTSYKFQKLAKNVNVKATLTAVKPEVKGETPDFPEGWFTVEADYAQEYLSGSVAVRSNGGKTLVDGSIALGYDDLAVGGNVVVDTASKVAPTDFNFGAEYRGLDYVVSGRTEKKRTALTLSYSQKLRGQVLAAQATFGLVKPTRSLTFGTDYVVDIDTAVRSYVKVESGKSDAALGFAISHRLNNPNVLLSVATEYTVGQAAIAAGKFGITLTAGDL